jgi:hypothetical protein
MTAQPYVRPKLQMGWVSWVGCAVVVIAGGPAAALAMFICYASGARSNYVWFRLVCGVFGVAAVALAVAGLLFVARAVLVDG